MSGDIPIGFRLTVEGDSEVVTKFEAMGDAIEQLGTQSESSSRSAREVAEGYLSVATSFGDVINAGLGAYDSYKKLEDGQLRIAQAERNVGTARASLLRSQEALTKLVSKGIEAGAQYELAQLKVKAAEEQLAISEEKAKNVHEDFARAQLDFALGVAPAIKGGIEVVQGALGALRAARVIDTAATAAQTTVNLGAAGSFTALTGATVAQAAATRAASVAARLFSLSMLPVTAPLLAVTTLFGLYATNAFGARDAMDALGKAIGDALPFLRPLLDTLAGIANTIFPQAEEQAQGFGETAAASLQLVSGEIPALTQGSAQMAENLSANYGEAAAAAELLSASTTGSLQALAANVGTSVTVQSAAFSDLGNAAVEAGDAVSRSFDGASRAAEKAADRISKAARKAADAMRSIGASKSSGSRTVQVRAAATGFSGVVSEPTLFLAGEAGPETVNIAPIREVARTGSQPIIITVITTLDGREVARSVSRYQAENI